MCIQIINVKNHWRHPGAVTEYPVSVKHVFSCTVSWTLLQREKEMDRSMHCMQLRLHNYFAVTCRLFMVQ